MPPHRPAAQRFWEKVEKTPSCWNWTAHLHEGYGRFNFEGRIENAHRVVFIMLCGSIPTDKVIDHKCRNRRCVNPDHLQLVTRGQNVLIGVGASAKNQAKRACPRGHSYDMVKKSGARGCYSCERQRQRAKYQRSRAALEKVKP